MAIVELTISNAIVSFLEESQGSGGTTDESKKQIKVFGDSLAKVIADAIKSATIVIPTGGVVVTGTALTQTNPAPVTSFTIS